MGHILGTFAVVCLMTGKVVAQYSSIEILQNGTQITTASPEHSLPFYSNVEVAATITFTVAIIQLAMYGLRLGIVSTLLSDTLVNGFTCASAFHVVASQLKDLLGLPIKKRRGNFSFPLVSAVPKSLKLPNMQNFFRLFMMQLLPFLMPINMFYQFL